MLRTPNEQTNLSFRLPSSDEWNEVSNRKTFKNLMIPVFSIETICDLSRAFLFDEAHIFNIDIETDSKQNVRGLINFKVIYESSLANYIHSQQQYSNSICVMYSQENDRPTDAQLRVDRNVLKSKCAVVFCKTSFVADDEFFVYARMENTEDDETAIVKVTMNLYACYTNENTATLNSIFRQGKATLRLIDKVPQFVKSLKILSIPDRPQNVPAGSDYNLSPVFDAIINPNLFFDTFSDCADENFTVKFRKLMQSEETCLLIEDGAPGTGKTTNAANTIANFIKNCLQQQTDPPLILVTAPSNAAADVFYLKLRHRLPEILICRLGELLKFKPEVREFAKNDFEQFSQEELDRRGSEISANEMKRNFILSSTIIVVTLGSSMMCELLNLRSRLRIDLLVVDECGQAKIDEFLFPFHLNQIRRILLLGDPRQLGPTLKSSLMMSLPTAKTSFFVSLCSYFQRTATGTIVHLRDQHRMHPLVANVVSHISYADTDPITTNPNGNWKKIKNNPLLMVFSGESWFQQRSIGSFSFENVKEAQFGMALLRASLRRNGFDFITRKFPENKALKYTIIPLYRGQVNLYIRLLAESHLDQVVDVFTVDKMQGSECDIAIVSAVRASAEHYSVGFASDLRRLNVALSRAACVYVLAKYDEFKLQQGWSKLFFYAIRNNCLFPDADNIIVNGWIDEVLETCSNGQVLQ